MRKRKQKPAQTRQAEFLRQRGLRQQIGDMAAIVDARAATRRVDSARIKPLPETTPTLIAMLRAPEGATIEEIMTATGWQSHTVRARWPGR